MFGTNLITGRSFFKEAPPNSLMVTSIFYSIQGEGPQTGKPAVFIRLSKCNLNCSFCDAMFEQGQYMTYTDLMDNIHAVVRTYWASKGMDVPSWVLRKSFRSDVQHKYGFGLVITGGEPAIQENVAEFANSALNAFDWVQTESNGIVPMDLSYKVTQVVSPKCLEKDGQAVRYLTPNDKALAWAHYLKFILSADAYTPYHSVPEWAAEWKKQDPDREIYVSPMNVYKSIPQKMKLLLGKTDKTLEERSTTDEVVSFWEPGVLDMEANRRNHEYAARYAMEHGFRFQVQAHLLASLA